MKEQKRNKKLVILFTNTLSDPKIKNKITKYNDDQISIHTFYKQNNV